MVTVTDSAKEELKRILEVKDLDPDMNEGVRYAKAYAEN